MTYTAEEVAKICGVAPEHLSLLIQLRKLESRKQLLYQQLQVLENLRQGE